MRTEGFRRGLISIMLVSAIVFSMTILMTFTATPVIAGGVISTPGGTTIEVVQGEEFTLKFKLYWDEPAWPGYFSLGFQWDSPKSNGSGTANENFTFVSASAYLEDNLDPISTNVLFTEGVTPENANMYRYSIVVSHSAGYPWDGNFYVDIVMRASGYGGVLHVPTNNHPIRIGVTVDVIELSFVSYSPPNPNITVRVLGQPDPDNIVRAKETAQNINQVGAPPWLEYKEGDRPPIMVAKRVGSGGVLAGGTAPTCRNGRWNDPGNPDPHFDDLLDVAFQWMVPGATNVLWYEGHYVYNTSWQCSDLIAALEALGYTVVPNATQPITSSLLAPYDILIIPQMQEGAPGTGGDPTLITDAEVTAIRNFVEGGGGFVIMEASDFAGYNYNKVQNKVLAGLDFDYLYQDDQVSDGTNNYGGAGYQIVADVDTTTVLGAAYQARTGKTTIGLYSACSLAKAGPGVSLYVLPDYQVGMPGATLEYTVTVVNPENPLAENLTYEIMVGDTADWSPQVENTSLFVPVDEKRTTTLTVTVPPDTSLSTESEITVFVAAIGYPEVNSSFTCRAHAGKRIEPFDDTYVSDQEVDANYSGESSLRIGRYSEYWEWPYLQFDLSGIPPGANITDARLYFYCYYKYAGGFDVLVHEVENDDWTENTITWNTKPTSGTILDTEFVDDASRDSPKSYSWDVTSFVVNEFAGDKRASFCLRPPDDLPESTSRAFWSKEHYEDRVHPFLRISYTTEVVERRVSVSVSPNSRSGSPGETLTFTVTVRNEGVLVDSYSLIITDTAGWSPSISPSTLWLDAGASGTATLTVTIPSGAEDGATDSITVTATSQADSTVSASDKCTAIAAAIEEPFYSTSIQGDYVAAGVGMRGTGSGTITISGIPGGSTIVKAFLYWAIVDVSEEPSFKGGVFDGTSITGTLIGTDDDPCWIGTTTTFAYRADVTALVPGNGIYSLTGFATGPVFTTPPLLEGASLVIVFSNPASAYRDIVIFDGADTIGGAVSSVSTTISGFTASAAPIAKTTYIVADGQDPYSDDTLFNGVIIASDAFDGSDGELWDTDTYDVSALVLAGDKSATVKIQRVGDCLVHIAQVFSVTSLVPRVGWDAFITATFSGGSDGAIFGVRSDATDNFDGMYDIPEPPGPPEPPYVRTFFYYPGQTPDELHRSCLAPENLMGWPLRIEYAEGLEDITLTWNMGNVPADYSVFLYRGENLVADMRAEDNYTFRASSGSYDFRIVVGTIMPFTLELTQGWNMISFPVLPENPSPDSIFGNYYVLYRWDAENKRYVLHADSGSFIEPDPDVEAGVGYWAYVLENENVDLLGVPVNQLTLNLRPGWNLIGPPYGGSSIADLADNPDSSVIPWAFTWNAHEKSYSMTQLLEAGKGYWAYALRDCTLELPSLFQPPQPGYPAISATSVKVGDNEIRINVTTGSIPAGEWAYSISSTEGSYSWIQGTEELDAPYVSLGTYAAGTYYVSLKHIYSGHVYFWDQTITISYPAIIATSAKSGDNEIRINVLTGSIPAWEWAYSISVIEGSYSWTTGTEELDAPYVSLGTYAAGTYYVSLRHIYSGHFYFWDQAITISYPNF